LHSTKWINRKKKEWKLLSSKNNSIEDSVGNEENGYSVPNANKTMINVTKEPSDAHQKTLKAEILEEITDKLM
jgi:hypothetical protein